MSFLKKLFSGKKNSTDAETPSVPVKGGEIEYSGFIIRATPFKEAGQYQSCGVILREVNGVVREHRFVRADRFSGLEDAVTMIHIKARQIIDEQGEKIFHKDTA